MPWMKDRQVVNELPEDRIVVSEVTSKILVDFDEGQWVGTNLHKAILLGTISVIIKVSLVTIPYPPHLA
jgi:hypothetical protein